MKRLIFIAVILVVLAAGAWLPLKKIRSGSAGSEGASMPLVIYFTGDVTGRLEPCGCFTGQYGGLTRLSIWLQESSAASADQTLNVDVGDALAGEEDYHIHQHRFLSQGFEKMNFAALNIGAREASLDLEQLRSLATDSAVPLVSANLFATDTGELVTPPTQVVERAGRRIAIVGVIDPKSVAERLGEGLRIEAMETALSNLLPAIKTEKADLVVLLAFTDEEGMRELAKRFYEFDVILGGDVPQPAQHLIRENDSLISYTTNQARAVGRLIIPPSDMPDAEPGFEMTLLHDGIPQARDLIELSKSYRDFLRVTPLAVDSPDDGEQADNDPNRIPGTASPFSYVGSEACTACHLGAHETWAKSGHSHAFETLKKKGAEADPNCIRCHTVGFGKSSGYRREFAGQRLAAVGCESCHGPGSEHLSQRSQALADSSFEVSFKFRKLGEADCTSCHYGEFSRPFVWKRFWPMIEHGEKQPGE
jgi:hypothetical protein